MLDTPALHRKTFNEMLPAEREAFLNELRIKRETLEARIKRVRAAANAHNIGSPIRKEYEKSIARIDKKHEKWLIATQEIESMLNELLGMN